MSDYRSSAPPIDPLDITSKTNVGQFGWTSNDVTTVRDIVGYVAQALKAADSTRKDAENVAIAKDFVSKQSQGVAEHSNTASQAAISSKNSLDLSILAFNSFAAKYDQDLSWAKEPVAMAAQVKLYKDAAERFSTQAEGSSQVSGAYKDSAKTYSENAAISAAKAEAVLGASTTALKLDKLNGIATTSLTLKGGGAEGVPTFWLRNSDSTSAHKFGISQNANGVATLSYSTENDIILNTINIPSKGGTILTTEGGYMTGKIINNVNYTSALHQAGDIGGPFAGWNNISTPFVEMNCQNDDSAYMFARFTKPNQRHLAAMHVFGGSYGKPQETRISFSLNQGTESHKFFDNRLEITKDNKTSTLLNDGNIYGSLWGTSGALSNFLQETYVHKGLINTSDGTYAGSSKRSATSFRANASTIQSVSYNNAPALEITGLEGGDAMVAFHSPGSFLGSFCMGADGNFYHGATGNRWKFLSERNTTIDANGFVKRASPIMRVYGNNPKVEDGFILAGSSVVNGEAFGATAAKESIGVYKISGSLGLAKDSWQVEIPTDDNGQALVWVNTEINTDGVITLTTFHREWPNSPPFARNIKEGYKDGQPIDIPDGRWLDLRLQMPTLKPRPVLEEVV